MSQPQKPMSQQQRSVFDEIAAAYLGRDYVNQTRARQRFHRRIQYVRTLLGLVWAVLVGATLWAILAAAAVLLWGWAL